MLHRQGVIYRLAARSREGMSKSSPSSERGMARRKRKPTGVHDPFGIAAGASRRHAHLQRPSSARPSGLREGGNGSACYLRRWSATGPLPPEVRVRRLSASASSQQNLIVGVPGERHRPGAHARVLHEPAGAAPRPASRTPRDDAQVDEVMRNVSVLRGPGITSCASAIQANEMEMDNNDKRKWPGEPGPF